MRRRPRVRIEAPQSGGGQERGMRSGTVPTPLTVGLGAACQLASEEMEVSYNAGLPTICSVSSLLIFRVKLLFCGAEKKR